MEKEKKGEKTWKRGKRRRYPTDISDERSPCKENTERDVELFV